MRETRVKDGAEWVIGGPEDVAWITGATRPSREIEAAVPGVFESYCTVLLPGGPDFGNQPKRSPYDDAVIALLTAHTAAQPWWLGYLETGVSDLVFDDAPMRTLYTGWNYVLVQAGPDQALNWRGDAEAVWNGPLPDLMFPADHSWLHSTLWDDEWTCIGGPEPLIAAFESDPVVGASTRRVALGEDATPPGHTAY